MNNEQLQNLLMDMINRWTQFAEGMEKSESPYDQGVAIGFNAAVDELRALLRQVYGEQVYTQEIAHDAEAVSFEVKPEITENEPEWEYFYLNFEQAPDGIWRIKHLNGVWQPNWQTSGEELEETVARLRENGWRLARFASGIHVFKRPLQPRKS